MTDLSMIILALGMVVLFMGPFFIISAIKDRKEAQQKLDEQQQEK
jgi:Sec-independent protein secretion pathway component TatC